MSIHPTATKEELAAIVAEQLKIDGIEAVLVGGAVVEIYSSGRYVTDDLDFVTWSRLEAIHASLAKIGFKFNGRIGSHPDSLTVLDFNNSPIVVGEKHITGDLLVTRKTRFGSFSLLSPLDSLLDRLSAYFHFQDKQGLAQAVMLFKDHSIDLQDVKRWCESEGIRTKNRADAYRVELDAFLDAIEQG
jgi:hypothetical protein